jgi:predicted membrane-bound spermidine synthase
MAKSDNFIGVFLISLATLLLELSLTRVMSVTLWYHFGFLVISTALLGFGAAGTVAACWKAFRDDYSLDRSLSFLSLSFGVVTLLSFYLLQKIPFNPFSIATDHRQLYILPLYYITISAPFFITGLILSLLFTRLPSRMSRLYAFDLIGAALGCLLIVWAMPALGAGGAVVLSGMLGAVAAIFFSASTILRLGGLLVAAGLMVIALFADRLLPIKISENKRSAKFIRKPLLKEWNVFSYVELFEYGPDSIANRPGGRVFVIDGGTAATDMSDLRKGVASYLEEYPADSFYGTAGAYLHIRNATVLNIGSGGGNEVLDALHGHAKRVVCAEINPIITDIASNKMNDFWGGLYHYPGVELYTGEARSYINRSREKFDVIVSSHTISNAAVASGSLSLSENFVLTKEAFEEYYEHLSDTGIILFSRPESQLPRLFTTGREVLDENGVNDIPLHFYAFRYPPSRQEGNQAFVAFYMMKKTAFSKAEIAALDSLNGSMHIMPDDEWKPIEVLYSPYKEDRSIYRDIVSSQDLRALYDAHPFQIAPATDDKPFFNQHVRWASVGPQTIRDVFSQNNTGSARLALENKPVAEVTLVIILFQSLLLATVLILLPLWRYRNQGIQLANRNRYLGYFAALGLGFIMLEVVFIQRFTLYLGQPIYTLAVIIAGLLLFTGTGSWLSGKIDLQPTMLRRRILPLLIAVMLLISMLTPTLFHATLHFDLSSRIILTLLLLAPLGILLGMPFPTGIRVVSRETAAFVPWAWAVNGFFTVIGSVTALILGMIVGFKVVILLAAACYLAAMFLLPGRQTR